MSEDLRLAMIKQRALSGAAGGDSYYCREHWGLFDGDADVLWLVAEVERSQATLLRLRAALTALEQEVDMHLLSATQDAKVNGSGMIGPYVMMFQEMKDQLGALLAERQA